MHYTESTEDTEGTEKKRNAGMKSRPASGPASSLIGNSLLFLCGLCALCVLCAVQFSRAARPAHRTASETGQPADGLVQHSYGGIHPALQVFPVRGGDVQREPLDYERPMTVPTPLPIRAARIVSLLVIAAVAVYWLVILIWNIRP